MRRMAWIFFMAILLSLLPLGVSLGPVGPMPTAQATHQVDIYCPTTGEYVSDGVLEPSEYSESFFDSKTKILVYLGCLEDDAGTMRIALVSPWDEWTEVRFQASDQWDGSFNVVRVSMSGPMPIAMDGFLRTSDASFVPDQILGGTDDVLDLAATHHDDYHIFEFGVPLRSSDAYDSQISTGDSIYFQLAYASDTETFIESDPHSINLGTTRPPRRWTSVELSLPGGSAAKEVAEMLVSLRDEMSRPLSLRPVSVFASTAFGYLDMGIVYTNEQGVAVVNYTPRDEGVYLIGAAFPGEEGYLASVAWHHLVLAPPTAQLGLFLRGLLVIEALIALVVGGVWATYAYSFYVLRQSLRFPDGGLSIEFRTGRR